MRTESELQTAGDASDEPGSFAGYLLTAERAVMGVVLLGFGISGILNIVPDAALPVDAAAFSGALMKFGFAYPLLKGVEVLLELYVRRRTRGQRPRAQVVHGHVARVLPAPRTRAWRAPRSGLRPALRQQLSLHG